MAAFTLVVPKEYPFVILACVVLAIECFVFTFVVVRWRVKTFSKKFLDA